MAIKVHLNSKNNKNIKKIEGIISTYQRFRDTKEGSIALDF